MAPPKKKKSSKASSRGSAKDKTKKKPLKGKTAKGKPVKGKTKGKRPGLKRPPTKTKRKRKPPERYVGPIKDNPEAHALAHKIAHAIVDTKGTDVLVLDVRGKASYADYIVVGSGDTERMVNALAEGVEDKLRPEGKKPIGREGEQTGNWVLLDYGEVVAHLFLSDARGFYDLEGLWADAPREKVV
ncbi:MAG: iojap-like protein [Myxococcaceae bacterium]|nr:iojap-like protein [Myxococcaceae bacterium]